MSVEQQSAARRYNGQVLNRSFKNRRQEQRANDQIGRP
jgi:hypothetical protein